LACVRRLVELFYPRLILGISDEIPPDGDKIERGRLVGEFIQELVPGLLTDFTQFFVK